MKKKGVKNLTYTQRLQIETLLNAKVEFNKIIKLVGISIRTLYYEVNRGAYNHLDGKTWLYSKFYSAQIAQERYNLACTSKGRPLKVGNDFEFVKYIENKVKQEKISACAVLGQIKRTKMPFKTIISKTTLYRYINNGIISNVKLGFRKKKKKKTKSIKKAPKGTSIEKRPLEIKYRKIFGHWEMDCIVGSNCVTLLTLTERLTRKEIIFKMENRKAESVVKCLNSLEHKFGKKFKQVFKSITVDNGVEFSNFMGLEKSIYGKGKRTNLYYCHPYCSCERGTNERLNREIRRLIPKGSNLAKYTKEDIQKVENWVNNYPRQILGYATSKEVFEQYLQNIA